MTSPENINLLKVLTRKNLKNSDYRTFLGFLWSFIGPTATFLVTYAIFNQKLGKNIAYFPLKLMIAIIVISYFTSTVGYVMRFLRGYSRTLLNTSINFEILLIPSLVVPNLKLIIELSLCCLLASWLHIFNVYHLPFLILTVVSFQIFTIGFGLILCVLYSLAADIEEIWNILVRLLFFVTPAFYTLDMLSPWGRNIVLFLNPLTPFVLCFQTFITNQEIPYYSNSITWATLLFHTLFFSLSGYIIFKKMRSTLLEVV